MELNRHPAPQQRGARSVRIAAHEESGEPSHAVRGIANLSIGRTHVRKLKQLAGGKIGRAVG